MGVKFDREARKAELAEATWQVILDKGVSALSVRNIANQAGVAVGSLRYLFPERADLIKFSAQLMFETSTQAIEAIPFEGNLEKYALAIITRFLPVTADARAELEINLALIAEAPQIPELIEIRNEAHEKLADGILRLTEALTKKDRSDPSVIFTARRLHAIIDGLAVHLLHHPLDEDPEWALDIIRQEISHIVNGADGEAERLQDGKNESL